VLPLFYFHGYGMMRGMRMKTETIASHQGVPLIELAIVLVIVGMLVTLGSSMVGVLTTAINVRQTKDTMDAVTQSVTSWASANNRLPDALSGATTTFTNIAKTPNDAWGRPLVYLYDSTLAPGAATKDTICGRRSAALTVSVTDPTAPATISNVAFVVLSGGDNGAPTLNSNFAINSTFRGGATYAVATPIPRTPAGAYAVGGNTTGTITVDPSNIDIVRWVTLDELRSKIGCQGAPLKIVNNELPYGYNNVAYNATIYADGGVPGTYRWCIQNSTGVRPENMTFRDAANTANIPFNIDCQNNVAEANWVQTNNIVIGGTPNITVAGTDGQIYTCTQSHNSAAANQPTTGANWTTYWQLGGSTGSTWAVNKSYPSSSNTLTIFVRDNNDTSGSANDNVASKTFVFTINP
jgi:hypothetical protein